MAFPYFCEMTDPQLIFLTPENYLDVLTDEDTEGQYFDRKKVGDNLKSVRKQIKECISAFCNSRGGLIAVGIANDGEITGMGHLKEEERNALVQVKETLVNHATQTREVVLQGKKLLLFYVPEGLSGICETTEKAPSAWIRDAAQCQPLTAAQREALLLQRNKKWEQLSPCDYDQALVNGKVLEVFKKRYLEEGNAAFDYSQEAFLQNIGAIKKDRGELVFTNAGFVFFANNPASLIPSVQVRFLRYDCEVADRKTAGTPNFDRTFDGCLPELLRKVRTFVNEGAFFKTYTYRNPERSGLIEEPELPPNAVEEAIVNALIHRDYHVPTPIRCILYKDAFVVNSPGKLLQPGFVPTHFDLSDQALESYPRNPKIVQWARTMVDENGQRFVKQLNEGHRTMLNTMRGLELPAPVFDTNGYTVVTLYNNYRVREERQRQLMAIEAEMFANLFPIEVNHQYVAEDNQLNYEIKKQLFVLLKDKLSNNGWFIDHAKAGRIIAHEKGKNIPLNPRVDALVKVFPAYAFQVHLIEGAFFLSIDYDLQLINITKLDLLYSLGMTEWRHRPAQVYYRGAWTPARIVETTAHYATVELLEYETTEEVPTQQLIPRLGRSAIDLLLSKKNISYPLSQKLKELSLSSQVNAARERADKILSMAKVIGRQIFPLVYNGYTASLTAQPQALQAANENTDWQAFSLFQLPEPRVKFANDHTDIKISEGLTQFGAFGGPRKALEIVPLCLTGYEPQMRHLLETLKSGSMRFRGLERTFGIRPHYTGVIGLPRAEDYLAECQRLLTEHPSWEGDKDLPRIFLVHVPEAQYPVRDFSSPYYQVKAWLLKKGIPVQMLDSSTLESPKFKDLNLALNIMAKTGGVPWVLPSALPDADLFIGLSYTQYKTEEQLYRTLGYANVFNQYGQWQYYKGNNTAFSYDEKHLYLSALVEETLRSIAHLPENPAIHLHYSTKFSKEDRRAVQKAVSKVRPKSRVTFVWINTGHNVRLFDRSSQGNGSLSRGSVVPMGTQRFYLSSTGYTPVAKTLGTSIMLEANVEQGSPHREAGSTLNHNVARHLLALTKLNWASSQSISGEPVTIKYARDIARLSQAFLQQEGQFHLHPVLERTPWFI